MFVLNETLGYTAFSTCLKWLLCMIMPGHLFQVPAAGISIPESEFLFTAVPPLLYFHSHNIIIWRLDIALPNWIRFLSKSVMTLLVEVQLKYPLGCFPENLGFVCINYWLSSWINLLLRLYVNEFTIYPCLYHKISLYLWCLVSLTSGCNPAAGFLFGDANKCSSVWLSLVLRIIQEL